MTFLDICKNNYDRHEHSIELMNRNYNYVDPPTRVRVNIVLLISASASASALHQLPRTPLLKFFGGGMFFCPRALAFYFCYDLDLCSKDQTVRAFFIGMGLP